MKQDMIKNFIVSAIASAILTAVVVGLVVGDKALPIASVPQNVIGNIVTAVICGGMSGLATTVVLYKQFKK